MCKRVTVCKSEGWDGCKSEGAGGVQSRGVLDGCGDSFAYTDHANVQRRVFIDLGYMLVGWGRRYVKGVCMSSILVFKCCGIRFHIQMRAPAE